ncbi:hypothetical protein ACEPPN_002684 [Leptodophora sp. 'Broadleaf-Isolate-01']
MGRTSKFSFPIPGRKHKEGAPVITPSVPGNNLSKAQRILGTSSNLNIDMSSIREEGHQQWRHPGSRSSGMSISISDSTRSAESVHELQSGNWEHESGLPKGMSEKASSTLLGRRYVEDGTATTSDRSGRLRNEDSSSTLKSFYDRQKTPLSISQQTSASSARDLALRKGCPPVVQRSPLLQVETTLDPFNGHFAASNKHQDSGFQETQSPEKRKKPGRLDLTKLFPKSRRHGDKSDSDYLSPSPSSASTNGSHSAGSLIPESTRRKLKKSLSKESMQSQKYSIRSDKSHEQRQTNGTLLQLYDHYEILPVRSPRMDQIPESRVPDRMPTAARDNKHTRIDPNLDSTKKAPEPPSSSAEKEPFSWKNVQTSLAAANLTPSSLTPSSLTPPNSNWESTSAASISSRNTRASKTTAGSSFSHSDLQEKSVLSLSSDSEDDSDTDPGLSLGPQSRGKSSSGSPMASSPLPRESRQQSGGLTARNYGQRSTPSQQAPFLTVPETSTTSSRLSGPWTPPPQLATPPSSRPQRHSQISSQRDKNDKPASVRSGTSSRVKPPSIASIQSLQAPYTPPLSPSSMMFRQTSERSSRFMAVTQQEEALLEALRRKRARMREEIIEEHETTMKTPPRESESQHTRLSSVTARSSASTLRPAKGADKKQTILLYLDTPIVSTQSIDTAEPSPDLDGFMGYGSDEESTPRTSWAPPRRGKPRPDSFVAPLQRQDTVSSLTPPSAARLSAVGSARGFKPERSSTTASKKRNTGVRFIDDKSVANSDDFLADEEPMLWNV